MNHAVVQLPATGARPRSPRAAARLRRWLRTDAGFRWLPVLPVQLFFLFVLPAFLLMVYVSLHRWRIARSFWWEADFGGLWAFQRVLADGEFWGAVGRTVGMVAAAVPLEVMLGFSVAYLVNREFRGRRFFTTLFLVPMMVVPVVVGYTFSMLFLQDGPLNQVLSWLTFVEVHIPWLSRHRTAQAAVVLADVWQWTPLMFLIFLSGLAGLPRDPIRAAQVMGATGRQVFWRVELPLLRPILIVAVVIRTMEALKLFDQAWILVRGGPGTATKTIAIHLYELAWSFGRGSEAAATSVTLLVLFAVPILYAIRLLRRERALLEREGRP